MVASAWRRECPDRIGVVIFFAMMPPTEVFPVENCPPEEGLCQVIDSLNQRANVAVAEREVLLPSHVARRLRHMIGLQIVGVSELFVEHHRLEKIDVALVRPDFLERLPVAPDIAEVDVENLSA